MDTMELYEWFFLSYTDACAGADVHSMTQILLLVQWSCFVWARSGLHASGAQAQKKHNMYTTAIHVRQELRNGRGRSGHTPSLPKAHLETGQYKPSLCLEAAQ